MLFFRICPEIFQSIGDRCFRTGRPRTVARSTQLDELSRTSYWKGGLGPLAQKSFRALILEISARKVNQKLILVNAHYWRSINRFR